jgi:hypothetical protein
MVFTTMTKTYSLEKCQIMMLCKNVGITITHDCNCEGISNHLLNEKLGKHYLWFKLKAFFNMFY